MCAYVKKRKKRKVKTVMAKTVLRTRMREHGRSPATKG